MNKIVMNLQRFAGEVLSAGTSLSFKKSGGTGTFSKLTVITATPDIGSDPERVDVTTLADKVRRYIKGIQDQENLAFPCIYRKDDFTKMKAAEADGGDYDFQLTYPDGFGFDFTGQVSVTMGGAEINGALAFTTTVIPNSEVKLVANRTTP